MYVCEHVLLTQYMMLMNSDLTRGQTAITDQFYSHVHAYVFTHTFSKYAQDASIEDLGDREKRLLDIYRNFQPAFRYFFLEKFGGPSEWVARRTAYTRSTAAASIVGYVLGIGDRHSHNILIDTVTAEAVHIDFGIVFEQGKTLGNAPIFNHNIYCK